MIFVISFEVQNVVCCDGGGERPWVWWSCGCGGGRGRGCDVVKLWSCVGSYVLGARGGGPHQRARYAMCLGPTYTETAAVFKYWPARLVVSHVTPAFSCLICIRGVAKWCGLIAHRVVMWCMLFGNIGYLRERRLGCGC